MYYKKTSSKQFVGIPMTGCCDGSRQYFILIGIDFLYQVVGYIIHFWSFCILHKTGSIK